MRLGLIGLGKMGSRIALKLLKEDYNVVVWNRSSKPIEELKLKAQTADWRSKLKSITQNLKVASSIKNLVENLGTPKIIWSMIPAGEATGEIINEVSKYVKKGDIVIDGGNSHYKDTEKRYQEFNNRGIRFLGIGVSGGVIAATQGYPLMAGGDKSAYNYIKPILDSLAKPGGGHEYFGTGGAGHFVKMIHNGIEYGFMQSLGEGFDVLHNAPYKLDLIKVAKLYQKGSLVSGFMLDRTVEVLANHPGLLDITGIIQESGEAKRTVGQAKEEGINVEVIERSLDYRRRSKTDPKIQKSFTAKLVAALRQAFGGHEIKENK